MNPLSLAAGVAGLLVLTSQTVRNYVNEVKHSKKTATYVLQELEPDLTRSWKKAVSGAHFMMIPRYWCHAREASETGSQRQLQSLRKDSRRLPEKYDPSSGH